MLAIKIDPTKELDKLSRFLPRLSALFSFEDTREQSREIVVTALKEQFASKGSRGGTPWDQLKDGSGQPTLVDTGKLRDALFDPKLIISTNAKTLMVKFSGEHSELIEIFKDRYPLVVLTKPDFNALGQVFVQQNIKRIKFPFGKNG